MVGHNVLMLTTTGRRSGQPHRTPMRYEHDPASDTYHVLSGWGGRTDWFRNVRADRRVRVSVGARSFAARAELLPLEATMDILRRYAGRNPFAWRTVRKETGIRFDGGDGTLRRIAAHYPAVALRQAPPVRPGG